VNFSGRKVNKERDKYGFDAALLAVESSLLHK
jgi:hypothetical protein